MQAFAVEAFTPKGVRADYVNTICFGTCGPEVVRLVLAPGGVFRHPARFVANVTRVTGGCHEVPNGKLGRGTYRLEARMPWLDSVLDFLSVVFSDTTRGCPATEEVALPNRGLTTCRAVAR